MRSATASEFEATRYWRYEARRMVSKRCQDIYYSDRGTEVASKHITYIRGKPVSTSYMVNPKYLNKECENDR